MNKWLITSQINIKNEFGAIMGLVGCVYVIFMANCDDKYFVTTISRLLVEFKNFKNNNQFENFVLVFSSNFYF